MKLKSETPIITNLVINGSLNAKINVVKGATTAAFTTAENKIPNVKIPNI